MLTLLIYVLILGVLAWVVSSIPMPDPFKKVAYGILVIILILMIAELFGVVHLPPPLR